MFKDVARMESCDHYLQVLVERLSPEDYRENEHGTDEGRKI